MSDEPTIGVGHLKLRVSDLDRSVAFYVALGMREAHERMRNLAILALRGGTHLLLIRSRTKPRPAKVPVDFTVPDVVAVQRLLRERGLVVGPSMTDPLSHHRTFVGFDPDGHQLTFTSEHDDHEEEGS